LPPFSCNLTVHPAPRDRRFSTFICTAFAISASGILITPDPGNEFNVSRTAAIRIAALHWQSGLELWVPPACDAPGTHKVRC
jgi:hypothetical protein